MTNEDRLAYAKLARFAMDMLYQASRDYGCCPQCCAPCSALKHFNDEKILSEVLEADPEVPGHLWWDDKRNRVSQSFLTKAWRMTECHDKTW